MAKKKIVFEEAVKRIDQIISSLESNSINLDDSIKYYEEALLLINECNSILDTVEGKVKKVVVTSVGDIVEEEFKSDN